MKGSESSNRPRSLSASTVEQGSFTEPAKLNQEIETLNEQVTKLEGEKKDLENRIAELVGASKETKEKADLISAEKKAKQYVSVFI